MFSNSIIKNNKEHLRYNKQFYFLSCWGWWGKQKRPLTPFSWEVKKASSHMVKRWTAEVAAGDSDCKGVGNGRKTVIQTRWASKTWYRLHGKRLKYSKPVLSWTVYPWFSFSDNICCFKYQKRSEATPSHRVFHMHRWQDFAFFKDKSSF